MLEKYPGETNSYEKKEKLEKKKISSWLKTVCAFANSDGGDIIFGVKEDNTIVGLEDAIGDSNFISEKIKTQIEPAVKFDMKILNKNGKDIIILSIKKGNKPPYFYVESGSRIVFQRVGNQSVTAKGFDILQLYLERENTFYDSFPYKKTKEDVTFNNLKKVYKEKTGNIFEENFLESFGLINKGELTVAGALFADGIQVFHSRIFCIRWRGLTKTDSIMEALDHQEFSGDILTLLKLSLEFIEKYNSKMWRKGNITREEFYDYPEKAIKEAIVNALVHRDYTMEGGEIQLNIFDDRIEITNPGGLIDKTFIQDQNIYEIVSRRRNPKIAELMHRLEFAERAGTGLKKIVVAYEKERFYEKVDKPLFKSTLDNFFVTLKNINYKFRSQIQNQQIKLTPLERQNLIVNMINENPRITTKDLSKKLEMSISTIKRDLETLVKNSIIKYVGGSKKGKWIISSKNK